MDADHIWVGLSLCSDAHGVGRYAVRSLLEAKARVYVT